MIQIIILIIAIVASLYLLMLFSLHNFRVLSNVKRVFKNDKILFVFPHPDDETMMAGGLISTLAKYNAENVHTLVLTKGEKGDEILKLKPDQLAEVRSVEYQKAMRKLGVKSQNTTILDLGDGKLAGKVHEAVDLVKEYIQQNSIDVVVTYERWGVYGHKDHVAAAKIIKNIKVKMPNLRTFYATVTDKMAKKYDLKSHIKDLSLEEYEENTKPSVGFFVPLGLWGKYRAASEYKSQRLARNFPLWFIIALTPIEYFSTNYD
jgi:LmbE family N-acetylglucosaminyl deacetylase